MKRVIVKRLGYDMRSVLQTAKQLIDDIRAGRPAKPTDTKISAVFEEEAHTTLRTAAA